MTRAKKHRINRDRYGRPSLHDRFTDWFCYYWQTIVIPMAFIGIFCFVGAVDGGADAGVYPVKKEATIQVVVTLDDGNVFVVEESEHDVTINTYGSSNPADWEITDY